MEITVRENDTSFLTVVEGQGKAVLMAAAVLGAKGEVCSPPPPLLPHQAAHAGGNTEREKGWLERF